MRSRTSFAALVFLAASGLAAAQADPARLAIEYSDAIKQNMGLLKDYSWKSSVEVQMEGEKKATQIAQVRFDAKGAIERTPIAIESEVKQKRGIRGKIQRGNQKDAKEFIGDVAKLLSRYELPSTGTVVDYFDKARFSQSLAEGGSMEITGKSMLKPDDVVTMWTDSATNLANKMKVRTWVPKDEKDDERIWIESTTEYDTLANGARYPKRTVVNIAAKEMRLIIEQFDHIKQGG